MYPSTTRGSDDTAGIITLRLGWSPTTGESASSLVTEGFGGRVVAVVTASCGGGSQGLQIAETTGDIHILQVEMRTPKLHA